MTTLFKTTTATKRHSRMRRLLRLGGIASLPVVALCIIDIARVHGQVSPLQIIALAEGTSNQQPVNLHVDGSNDVLQTELIFQPGAQVGWHYHPGPVVVVIKTGALTEIHSDGCITVHPQGSVFFEKKDEIHNAINETGQVAEVYATFLSPAGAPPLIPVPNPGGVCQAQRGDH